MPLPAAGVALTRPPATISSTFSETVSPAPPLCRPAAAPCSFAATGSVISPTAQHQASIVPKTTPRDGNSAAASRESARTIYCKPVADTCRQLHETQRRGGLADLPRNDILNLLTRGEEKGSRGGRACSHNEADTAPKAAGAIVAAHCSSPCLLRPPPEPQSLSVRTSSNPTQNGYHCSN